jgi:hypothetical protein
MAALNAEIPAELKKAFDHACLDRDLTLKAAVAEALQNWVQTDSAPSRVKHAADVTGIFEQLNEDQIWRLQMLAELFRTQPQTPAFQILGFALDQAIKEHVAPAADEGKAAARGKHRKQAQG